jgi:hypothetical protein
VRECLADEVRWADVHLFFCRSAIITDRVS